MGSDKIFMFDNPVAGESAGIMSMIPGRKNFIRFLKNIIPVAFLKMMS